MPLKKSLSNVDLSFTSTAASNVSADDDSFEDWMYWQRDLDNENSWTRVYGVLENEFLWLFQGEKSSKTLLIQIAVASVEESGDRQLRIVDPNGEDLEISLFDRQTFHLWKMRLHDAAVLTTAHFRAFAIEVKDLPRGSQYRGSLVTYRRVRKRAKCKAALDWMAKQWKKRVSICK
ncbi:TPA: hypothetical protein N0F65_012195 [Lagenidium giganteum]|uniref:LAGLIDADG endonuclease n=1 Tax=Lagenidium giganteum TaxID=4803 RepID=A0AAV2ZD02_9STRA|nr:TPA: hypothetical protein N0F65_012195 [Lagenidium giganteum]